MAWKKSNKHATRSSKKIRPKRKKVQRDIQKGQKGKEKEIDLNNHEIRFYKENHDEGEENWTGEEIKTA